KGKSEPITAFRVVERRARPTSARGIEGLSSPIVGRDRELRLLAERVAELGRGHGQIVSIIGEAGLGKSRLLAELKSLAIMAPNPPPPATDGRDENNVEVKAHWLEGRAMSDESTTPF